jgi:hypothetical protein
MENSNQSNEMNLVASKIETLGNLFDIRMQHQQEKITMQLLELEKRLTEVNQQNRRIGDLQNTYVSTTTFEQYKEFQANVHNDYQTWQTEMKVLTASMQARNTAYLAVLGISLAILQFILHYVNIK